MGDMSSTPNTANQDRVDYYKIWGLDEDKDHLIMATTDYAVWLDKVGDLDWETTEAFDGVIEKKLASETISGFLNRAAILQSYPVEHLTPVQRKNFRIMVGEGLARAFDFQEESATQMLDKAAEYGAARNQEIARLWYLTGAVITAIVFVLVLLVAFLNEEYGVKLFGETKFFIGLGSCVGAVGALLSVLLRAGKVPLDPSAGPLLHHLEGGGRVLIGFLSAAVIQVAAHAGIAFTIFEQKGHVGIFIIAFAAGFSEQLAHTIIKKVEMTSAPKNKSR
jgi:hypothetical protein